MYLLGITDILVLNRDNKVDINSTTQIRVPNFKPL